MKLNFVLTTIFIAMATTFAVAAPVALYQAKGNGSDATVNHHDGTVSSDVTFTAGRIGQGLHFPGTDTTTDKNAVIIPDSADFTPTNLTVSVWVKFSSLTSAVSGNCPSGAQFILYKGRHIQSSQTPP